MLGYHADKNFEDAVKSISTYIYLVGQRLVEKGRHLASYLPYEFFA